MGLKFGIDSGAALVDSNRSPSCNMFKSRTRNDDENGVRDGDTADAENKRDYSYSYTADVGPGSYEIKDKATITGNINLIGTYHGFGHGGSPNAAGAVGACVTGSGSTNVITILNDDAGVYFRGTPATYSIGVGFNTDGQGSIGVGVSFSLGGASSLRTTKTPSGDQSFTITGTHRPGANINKSKTLKISAGSSVQELNDNEWDLSAWAAISGELKQSPDLIFTPDR